MQSNELFDRISAIKYDTFDYKKKLTFILLWETEFWLTFIYLASGEYETATCQSNSVRLRWWLACGGRRNKRFNCGSNNRKGFILCTGPKPRKRFLLYLPWWDHSEVDVPRILGFKRIGMGYITGKYPSLETIGWMLQLSVNFLAS